MGNKDRLVILLGNGRFMWRAKILTPRNIEILRMQEFNGLIVRNPRNGAWIASSFEISRPIVSSSWRQF